MPGIPEAPTVVAVGFTLSFSFFFLLFFFFFFFFLHVPSFPDNQENPDRAQSSLDLHICILLCV